MSEWISVEERLPSKGKKVLTYSVRDGVHHMMVDSIAYKNVFLGATGVRYTVTHWMPLPEPPAEEYKPRHMREDTTNA